jgi:hypothetical protein
MACCDYVLPEVYAAEEARVAACAHLLPELSTAAAEALFHSMTAPAVSAILARFRMESSANNYSAGMVQQAILCATIRVLGAEQCRATAWMIDDECQMHLLEEDGADADLTWEAGAAAAMATLLRLWKGFHANMVAPGAPARALTAAAALAFAGQHGCAPAEYALRAMMRALVPRKTSNHFYDPISQVDFDIMTAPAAAAIQRHFRERRVFPTACLYPLPLLHKAEAAERLADMWACDYSAVALHLSRLELQGKLHWPACLVQIMCLFAAFQPPLRTLTTEQVRCAALCRARGAVVRALSRDRAEECVIPAEEHVPAFLDTVTKALLLLHKCLLHTCYLISNPYDVSLLRAAIDAFPKELYKYWQQCLPALASGDGVAYATQLSTFDAKWRRLLAASVRANRSATGGAQYVFSLYGFACALGRRSVATGVRMVHCTDMDWPAWTPATAALMSGVFPPDAATCASPSLPLVCLPPSVDKHLAFAPPSPRLLFTKVYRQGDATTSSWVDAFAMMWGAAHTARRNCEALGSMVWMTGLAPALRRSKRSRGEMLAGAACLACNVEHSRLPDGCPAHPMCCQCYLTSKELLLVERLRMGGGGARSVPSATAVVIACCVPGCGHAHSLDTLRALLTSDMRTVLHMVLRAPPAVACAFCSGPIDVASADTVAACGMCRMETCKQCLGLAHPGEVCSAAFLREAGTTPDVVLSEAKMQRCPGCASPTVKSDGCNHMTCTGCGCHWCWLCGARMDARDPSAHFADVEGGTPGAACQMLQYSTASEVTRIVAAIRRREDISEELKTYCIEAVSGRQRSGTLAHTLADI